MSSSNLAQITSFVMIIANIVSIIQHLYTMLPTILYRSYVYVEYMEQLTKVVTLRLTEEEYKLLHSQAAEARRTIGWLAREKIRETLVTAN